MGGGGRSERVVQTTAPSAPEVLSELRPFVRQVGFSAERAAALPELQPERFARDMTLAVPGLSPLEQFSRQLHIGRAQTAFPVEQAATFSGLSFLSPWAISASPAVRGAIAGLESQIIPAIENRLARMGLASSGALGGAVGQAYARELVPLYQRGLELQAQMIPTLMGRGDIAQAGLERAGELERLIELSRAQADLESFLRQRELAMALLAPATGGIPIIAQAPAQTVLQRRMSGGGLGLGK